MTTTIRVLVALLLMSNGTPSGQPTPKQPSDYTPAAQPNVVTWQLKRLPPPSALYVTADDVIIGSAASSQANEVVTINIRRLDANDARPHVEQFVVQPGSNRAVVSQSKPLAEGFILSISCQAAVATTRGQTFLRVALGNAAAGGNKPLQMLMADYVTTAMAPAHPNGRVLAPSEGPGFGHVVIVASPAAGADWLQAVPTNARWRMVGIVTTLNVVNSGGARGPSLTVTNGLGNDVLFLEASQNLSINKSWSLSGSIGPFGSNAFGFLTTWALPRDTILLPGWTIGSGTANIAPADQWSATALSVEEWLDNV